MAVGLPALAGNRIQAATIAAIAPMAVIKPTDQDLASNTTLQNDTALVLTLPTASATYTFRCMLNYEGGTASSSDLKWQWAIPAGASLIYAASFINNSGNFEPIIINNSATTIAQSNGAGQLRPVFMDGSLTIGTTTGSLQLQWAQHTSSGTNTIVHAQSYVSISRIT